MNLTVMPADIAPPAANYAHAVLDSEAGRWLHTSGVVPVRRGRHRPRLGRGRQADVVWANLAAILRAAGMAARRRRQRHHLRRRLRRRGVGWPSAMAARDAFLGGRRVASTLVTVPALAQPAWLIEIALIAAAGTT